MSWMNPNHIKPQRNIYGTPEYEAYWQAQKAPFLGIPHDEEKTTPLSDGYALHFKNYHTIYGSADYAWVTLLKDNTPVYEYECIRPHYHFSKLIKHSNGRLYYLFRLDAQGYSLLDIEAGKAWHYIPQSMLEDPDGESLFLYNLQYNPHRELLIASCCYWGPVDRPILFDVSSPEQLPYPSTDIPPTDDYMNAKEVTRTDWSGDDIIYSYNDVNEEGKEILLRLTPDDYLPWLAQG